MDDEELKPKPAEWPPKSLDHLSLQAELARVRRIAESRTKQRNAADAIFKR